MRNGSGEIVEALLAYDRGQYFDKHLIVKEDPETRKRYIATPTAFFLAILLDMGMPAEVNAIANFTFLTQETNLEVSDRDPSEYLEEYIRKQPGAVESHWIPMDRELWKVENYLKFLDARRELLAQAANSFLDSLIGGEVPETKAAPSIYERIEKEIPGGVESEEEERLIKGCNDWVIGQGLSEGEYMYELVDEETGEQLAIVDLAWPNGLQEGLSKPVALLIDEGPETESAVNKAGYTYFTSEESLKQYIQTEIMASE